MSVRHLVREERKDLAAFLSTITPEDWERESLCRGWRVRDVVAHTISFDELGLARSVRRLMRGGFSPHRANARAVADAASRTTDDLLAALERHLDPRGPLTALGCLPALMDTLVHHQDIRRALGAPRDIPAERLSQGLRAVFLSPFVGGPGRARGLRFVAADIDWAKGTGPEVTGTAESIMMAVAGRAGVIDELSGPGCSVLAARMGDP